MPHASSSMTPRGLSRLSKQSPFIGCSVGFHAVAAVGICASPVEWPLWICGIVANHLVLSTVGLVPKGRLLGPNITRLPTDSAKRGEVAITIDDGPDPDVTPNVLRILAEHGAKATFFCIGERVRAFPEVVREISRAGHAVENHSRTHSRAFSLFGISRIRAEVLGCQDDVVSVVGRVPNFFRAPAGLRNPLLQPVLSVFGLRLVSWTRRGFDTVEASPGVVQGRLLRGLAAGDILLLHDGSAARTPSGRAVILEVLPDLLRELRRAGLRTVTLDEAFDAACDGELGMQQPGCPE